MSVLQQMLYKTFPGEAIIMKWWIWMTDGWLGKDF